MMFVYSQFAPFADEELGDSLPQMGEVGLEQSVTSVVQIFQTHVSGS